MENKFRGMSNVLDCGDLSRVNTTYINRKSMILLTSGYENTFLRVGEKYIALLMWLFRFRKTIETENFDFTGFADDFFKVCVRQKYFVLVLGGTSEDITKFIDKITLRYAGINIVGFNGYSSIDDCVSIYNNLCPDICVLGLGNPKQNIVLERLASKGHVGIHTCGAFISQEGRDIPVYTEDRVPRWIKRSIKEKGHFRRVIVTSITAFTFIARLAFSRN